MANTLLAPNIIAKEAALQVTGNLVFARLAHKQFKEDYNVKVGSTISYRKPLRFTVTNGAVLTDQNVIEQSGTISVNSRKSIGWNFGTSDLTLTIDQYAERYIRPAAIALANQIDLDGAAMALQVFNAVGTAGTAPTFSTVAQARQRLNEFLVPLNDRYFAVNPAGEYSIQNSLTSMLQPSLIEDITRWASIGMLSGMDLYMDQNVQKFTATTATGIAVNANVTDGSSTVSLTASGAGTLNNGDILTFGGSVITDAVNPLTKADLGYLQQFVVVGGPYSLSGSPTTVSLGTISSGNVFQLAGAYQTVTALPTTASTVTALASHTKNVAWMKNAFALVTVPLVVPRSAVYGELMEFDGIGMRFLVSYDPINDVEWARLDVLYGWACTYPELATLILG